MTLLLSLVARFVRAHPIPHAPGPLSHILVVDLNFLGDMLLASPVFRALRQAFPNARIDALVYEIAAPAVRINPFLDHVHTIAARSVWGGFRTGLLMRRERYDLVCQLNTSLLVNTLLWTIGSRLRLGYDYRHRGCLLNIRVPIAARTARMGRRTDECVELLERAFGLTIPDRSMIFPVSDASRRRVALLLTEAGIGPGDVLIGMHVNCRQGRALRRWDASRFAELGRLLLERHAVRLVFTGGAEDGPYIQTITSRTGSPERILVAAGRVSFEDLGALLERLTVFVTLNTGPMHIAVAVGTPTVAIIGGTPAAVVYPRDDDRFRYVEDPALQSWDPGSGRMRVPSALNSITPADVLAQVEALLHAGAGRGGSPSEHVHTEG